MNKVLLKTHLLNRDSKRDIDLEEIILGDVAQRDKQREEILFESIGKHLMKIIGE